MEQKTVYHYINLNRLDTQKAYDSLVRSMTEIAGIIDETRGTDYADDAEHGKLTVPELLELLHFGDMTYMKYSEAKNKYVMIPFCVLYGRPGGDNISDAYVFYSGSRTDEKEVKNFKTWLSRTTYNDIFNNIKKKCDEEAVGLIQNHNTLVLYKDNIYTI